FEVSWMDGHIQRRLLALFRSRNVSFIRPHSFRALYPASDLDSGPLKKEVGLLSRVDVGAPPPAQLDRDRNKGALAR
ncbi:hypothetical protein HAX54_010990, partial [Datura stramonium]|nr:hypothetical protein [Datura stramonium]